MLAPLLAMTANLLQIMQSGKVTFDVTTRFPLAEAAAAHRALESRETTGATVLLA